jgi:hypothetical protein
LRSILGLLNKLRVRLEPTHLSIKETLRPKPPLDRGWNRRTLIDTWSVCRGLCHAFDPCSNKKQAAMPLVLLVADNELNPIPPNAKLLPGGLR